MNKNTSIYVAGHLGLVGRAIVRRLNQGGYTNLIFRTHSELDLCKQQQVDSFFAANKPEVVIQAAAKVGGILANSEKPADFLYQNLMISTNLIEAAREYSASKFLNLGSSCIYPRLAPQPLREDSLLSGPLEQTNAAYAIAKIAAVKQCYYYNKQYGTNFLSLMPTNLYGPFDNFDPQTAHVIPALIRKIYTAAKNNADSVVLWGSGSPRREFLHVDDLADACIYLMETHSAADIDQLINVGTGTDITIMELADQLKRIIGFGGDIVWDTTKPDGTPRKLLDVSKIHSLGWQHKISLAEGLEDTFRWFVDNYPDV